MIGLDTISLCGAATYAEVARTNFALLEAHVDALETSSIPSTRAISVNAPLTGGGTLAADVNIAITQATSTTDGFISKTDWIAFNGKITNPMSQAGDLIYGGALGVPTRLSVGGGNTLLHGGGAPSWSTIVEADITLSDVGTLNASTTKHGFCPRLTNVSTEYLNGQGNWGTPGVAVNAYTKHVFAGSVLEVVVHNFGTQPIVQVFNGFGVVTDPASITHDDLNQVTITFGAPSDGTIILSVGSPQAQSYLSVAVDYTVTPSDRIIKVTVAGKKVTMMTAVGNTGREFVIDNAANGNITLAANGAELIEGVTAQTLPPDSAVHVYSDGAGWRMY